MDTLVAWYNESDEHKGAFVRSKPMQDSRQYLRGRPWSYIRKVRLLRFIRRLIAEGIVTPAVREICTEACTLLSEMEHESDGREEEEQAFMGELVLLRNDSQQVLNPEPPPSHLPHVITSLDGVQVTFSDSGCIRIDGNTIIHQGPRARRHCFLGGEMHSVCVLVLRYTMKSLLLPE